MDTGIPSKKTLAASLVTLALLAPLRAHAVPGPQEPVEPPRLEWRYAVQVEDAALGVVGGEAKVDLEQGVRVTLTDPRNGRPHFLTGGPPTWSEGGFVFELEGTSPAAPADLDLSLLAGGTEDRTPEEERALGEFLALSAMGLPELPLAEGSAELRVRVEGLETRVQVSLPSTTPAPGTGDLLTLRLAPRDDGSLAGTWSFRADPRTGRDAAGGGRIGVLRTDPEAPGALVQEGAERWRPLADIQAAFVPGDQTARRNDIPLSEFGPVTERSIFVVGHGLPRKLSEVRRIVPLDVGDGAAPIDYRVFYFDALAGSYGSYDRELERGWSLARGMARGGVDLQRSNAVLVRARIPAGTPPGRQRFLLNGAAGEWALEYGDVLGALTLAHADTRSERPEHVAELFVPEEVVARLYTSVDLPRTSLGARLVRRGVRGEQIEEFAVLLTKSPDDPKLYESGVLVARRADLPDESPGSATAAAALRVRAGEQLELSLEDPAQVLLPVESAITRIAVPRAGAEGLWRETLSHVVKIHELGWSGWDGLERSQADSIDNVSWLAALEWLARKTNPYLALTDALGPQIKGLALRPMPGFAGGLGGRPVRRSGDVIRSLTVSAGDHAAMLLLRRTFVELCLEQERTLKALPRDERLARFGRSVAVLVDEPGSAWAHLPVGRSGAAEAVPLSVALDEQAMAREGLAGEAYLRFREGAVEEALGLYLDDLANARLRAATIEDDDLRGLLELTGFQFRPVVDELLPRLVTFEEGLWRPDAIARARVESLFVLAQAVRDQEALADEDTLFFVRIGGMMTLPLWGAGGGLAVAAAALETASAGVEAVHAGLLWSAARDELAFARAAEPLLGPARRQIAELEESETFQMLAWAVASTAAVGSLDAGILQDVRLATRTLAHEAELGDRLVNAAADGGLDALRGMSRTETATLFARMAELERGSGPRFSRRAATRSLQARDRIASGLRRHLEELEGVPYGPLDSLAPAGAAPAPVDLAYERLRGSAFYQDAEGAVRLRGRPFTTGGFASVHTRSRVPGGPESEVIKFYESFQLPTHGEAAQMVRDIERGSRILEEKGVPQVELRSVVPDAAMPYLTQRALGHDMRPGVRREWIADHGDSFVTLRADGPVQPRRPGLLRPPVREAVLDLLFAIHGGPRPAAWADMRLPNIALEELGPRGSPLRATVVDQDQIEWWDTLRRGTGDGADFRPANEVERMVEYLRTGRIMLPSHEPGHAIASAEEFLVRNLERNGYIRHSLTQGWQDGMIEVAALRLRIPHLDDYLPR